MSTAQGSVAGILLSPRVRQFLGIPCATAVRWTAPSAPLVRTSGSMAERLNSALSSWLPMFYFKSIRTRLTGPQQSNLAAYIGNNIVDVHDDVIVVTFNYRTNIFGQPNAPQFNTPGQAQNFGLLDIAAAIEWVHANIAEFGGDPGRITLFGQSAGSVAIDAYVYALLGARCSFKGLSWSRERMFSPLFAHFAHFTIQTMLSDWISSS